MTDVTNMLNKATELMGATVDLISACAYTSIYNSNEYENANKAVVDIWNTLVPVGRSVNVPFEHEGGKAVTISKARMVNDDAVVNIRFVDSDVEAAIRLCELVLVDNE